MVKYRILILRLSGTLWESINHHSHRCRSLFGGSGSDTTTFRLDTVGVGLASSNLGPILVPHVAIATVPPWIVAYLPSEDEIRLSILKTGVLFQIERKHREELQPPFSPL